MERSIIEPAVLRMLEETSGDGVIDKKAEGFFSVETSPRFEYTRDLGECQAPRGYVMDNSEIENGSVGRTRHGNRSCIPDPEVDLRTAPTKTLASESNHPRIKIERSNRIGTEKVKNELRSDATAATDLKSSTAAHCSPHAQESRCFKAALKRRSNRIVHDCVFDPVQQQAILPIDWPDEHTAELPLTRAPLEYAPAAADLATRAARCSDAQNSRARLRAPQRIGGERSARAAQSLSLLGNRRADQQLLEGA